MSYVDWKEIDRLSEDNARLREALKPLAAIKLWSDEYPDCRIDHVMGDDLSRYYFTVDQVKAARKALGDEQ